MTLEEAEGMVAAFMRLYSLHGWKFEWMQPRKKFRRAGQCAWSRKTIMLQPYFARCNYPFIVKRTVLHEIAHALVGARNGHNRVWKEMAIKIGDDGGVRYGKEVKKRLRRKK